MKKVLALVLALVLLCSASVALAASKVKAPANINGFEGLPATPALSTFASMKTKQRGNTITVTLTKPVDKIEANWCGYKEVPEELTLDENNVAKVNTAGHKYQLGVHWTNEYVRDINWNSYVEIPIGTDPAEYSALRAQAARYVDKYYYCLEYNLPRYELYRVSNGGDVLVKTIQEKNLTEKQKAHIEEDGTPENTRSNQYWLGWTYSVNKAGDPIYGVDGEAYAWRQLFLAGVASAQDIAYITQQNEWTVCYNRKGQIVSFTYNMQDSNLFGQGTGTGAITFEKGNRGWYIRTVAEKYEDGTAVVAHYSKTGNGALSYVEK
jgi:hypothetical protein